MKKDLILCDNTCTKRKQMLNQSLRLPLMSAKTKALHRNNYLGN